MKTKQTLNTTAWLILLICAGSLHCSQSKKEEPGNTDQPSNTDQPGNTSQPPDPNPRSEKVVTDEDAVMQAKNALVIGYAQGDSDSSVKKNITLPTMGIGDDGEDNQVTITWKSNKPRIINVDTPGSGTVTRPSSGEDNAEVTLTATLKKNAATDTRTFPLTVIARAFAWSKIEVVHWPARSFHRAVTFDGKMWVLGGHAGSLQDDVWWSSDGITWTEATNAPGWPARERHAVVVFDEKIWVLGGRKEDLTSNGVWSSSDGVTWAKAQARGPNEGDRHWSARSDHAAVAFDNKMWVLGGFRRAANEALNDVWWSSDGTIWTKATVGDPHWPARLQHTAFVFNNKMWVMGGSQSLVGTDYLNDIWSRSSDGATWTQTTARGPVRDPDADPVQYHPHWDARQNYATAVLNNKIWVMGGFGGSRKNDIWSSSDGMSWTQTTVMGTHWLARTNHAAAVLNNKMWIMGGFDGSRKNDVWSSSDGDSWTKEKEHLIWLPRSSHAVVFNEKIWVLGGKGDGTGVRSRYNDVWSSSDGESWTNANARGPAVEPATDPVTYRSHWSARENHAAVVFNNKMWVLGGFDGSRKNDVWSSSDGTSWAKTNARGPTEGDEHWSARNGHAAVVFNNKMWVLGGTDGSPKNDVWSSSDGTSWAKTNARGPMAGDPHWSARNGHAVVVFDNKMWVLGGGTDGNAKNDVWSSSDGANWTKATDAAGWSARANHAAAEFDGKIWVVGGDDGSQKNDVWWSTDGAAWKKLDNDTSHWPARSKPGVLVLGDKMLLLGGAKENTGGNPLHFNDMWVYQETGN